jgi:hypothetical protein
MCTLCEAVDLVHLIYHDQNAPVSPSSFERGLSANAPREHGARKGCSITRAPQP